MQSLSVARTVENRPTPHHEVDFGGRTGAFLTDHDASEIPQSRGDMLLDRHQSGVGMQSMIVGQKVLARLITALGRGSVGGIGFARFHLQDQRRQLLIDVFHVFQPLAPKSATDPGEFVSVGFQRWYRTWAIDFKSTEDVYWNYDGSPLDIADLPNRAFDAPSQRGRTAAIYDDYNKITAASPAVDKEFADLAAERVAAHPLRYYIELPILRVANMWLRPRTEMLPLPDDWWRWHLYHRVTFEIAVYAALNLAYLILAALGLGRWRRQQWTGRPALSLALVGFVVMRTAMLLTVDNSEPRYTMDCFPVVILLAAFAFTRQSTRQDGQPTAQRPSYVTPS